MAYITETHGLRATILGRIADFLGEMAKSYTDARLMQRTYDELDSLSQRELDDLGIDKTDIARIAREATYGK